MTAARNSLHDSLAALVALIETQSPGVLASVLLVGEDGLHLRHGAAPSLPEKYVAAVDGLTIGPCAGSCGTAAYRKQAVFVEDIASDPLWASFKALALPHGLRACWSTPIFDDEGRVLGTFAMYGRTPGLPSPEHLRLTGIATRLASVAIRHDRAESAWRASEHRLQSALARTEAILRAAVDAIVTIDERGTVETLNPAAERLFGYPAAQIVGKNVRLLMPEPYRSQHDGYLDHYRATGEKHIIGAGRDVDGLRKDGSTFPLHLSVSEVMLEDRRRFIGMMHDMTEHKQYEQKLLVAKNTAELANRAKDAFLATMSHEIRTPLGAVLGMVEVLSLTKLDPDQQETLRAVWDSSQGLLRIVSDVLDWSKIEEGKLELAPQPTSISLLLQEVVNTYSRVASATSVVLRQTVAAGLSPAHLVDPLRLSQVLNNFVSNALKFTARGRVDLRADLLERTESGERVRFSVRDTGPGIAADVQKQLFQPYRQESANTARLYGGTGLGLSICRRLADLMNGEIGLDSAPGRGSTFSLTLTLPVSDAPPVQTAAPFSDAGVDKAQRLGDGGATAPRVLVVDDHPINRNLLNRQLTLLGLRVDTAHDGRAALSMWQTGTFALVITDCHMAEMDGYALTDAIRTIEANKRLARTPIIGWTANAREEDERLCYAAGMDDRLVKPVRLSQLRRTLARWLPAAETPARRGRPSTRAPAADAPPIDLEVLREVVPEPAEQRELLHEFQSHLSAEHATLMASLERGELADVERGAHRLKGACRVVGATALAKDLAAVERAAHDGNLEGARAAGAALQSGHTRLELYLNGLRESAGGDQ